MPDPIFAHPRLAEIYDTFDGDRSDLDAYVALVGELGVEPGADASTDPSADTSTDRSADASTAAGTAASADPGAATIVDVGCGTGNLAVRLAALGHRVVGAALRPGGHFVFETRRPQRRAWEQWAADTAPVVREVPGIGLVEQRNEVFSVDLPYVSFRYTYRFPDDSVLTSESTLRFRERDELESSLGECGFDVVDVREAPDRMGKEYVFIGRRRDR
ncbi:SAM-dependent methyltransferase [Catenulispora sp. EB89]|uniref:SAM-dependent methyltransferase n=1 Tax=Catenulispora sp. EB89 TaxID=3156257 RepID=UPI0035159C9C